MSKIISFLAVASILVVALDPSIFESPSLFTYFPYQKLMNPLARNAPSDDGRRFNCGFSLNPMGHGNLYSSTVGKHGVIPIEELGISVHGGHLPLPSYNLCPNTRYSTGKTAETHFISFSKLPKEEVVYPPYRMT